MTLFCAPSSAAPGDNYPLCPQFRHCRVDQSASCPRSERRQFTATDHVWSSSTARDTGVRRSSAMHAPVTIARRSSSAADVRKMQRRPLSKQPPARVSLAFAAEKSGDEMMAEYFMNARCRRIETGGVRRDIVAMPCVRHLLDDCMRQILIRRQFVKHDEENASCFQRRVERCSFLLR